MNYFIARNEIQTISIDFFTLVVKDLNEIYNLIILQVYKLWLLEKTTYKLSCLNMRNPYLTRLFYLKSCKDGKNKRFDSYVICMHWEKFITSMKRPSTTLLSQLLSF